MQNNTAGQVCTPAPRALLSFESSSVTLYNSEAGYVIQVQMT